MTTVKTYETRTAPISISSRHAGQAVTVTAKYCVVGEITETRGMYDSIIRNWYPIRWVIALTHAVGHDRTTKRSPAFASQREAGEWLAAQGVESDADTPRKAFAPIAKAGAR